MTSERNRTPSRIETRRILLIALCAGIMVTPHRVGAQTIVCLPCTDSPLDLRTIDSIAAVWRGAASKDAYELNRLVNTTVAFRDARMVKAALAASMRKQEAVAVRVAALRVLYSFAAGDVSADLPDSLPDPEHFIGGAVSERGSIPGPQSVSRATLVALRDSMRMLSSDSVKSVRDHAGIVHHEVAWLLRDPPQFEYLCGTRFRIRNPNDLWYPITYAVDGSSEGASIILPPRKPGSQYDEQVLEAARPGTVRFKDFDRDLAVVPNAGTRCR